MPVPSYYVVDRFEGGIAVLVADDGVAIDVPRTALPAHIREGTVLRVRREKDGKPDWSGAEVDETERARRLEAARQRLNRLGKRDPGGDLAI